MTLELPAIARIAAALVAALLISFIATPVVKSIAQMVGAVDVPKDNRRMHNHPIPRMGGLAIFLGFVLATVSIQGLFKFYTIISFAVPFLMLGLPLFDTCFAILRRLAKGQSPMAPDRSHVHHRLIDMGFNQKQAVAILHQRGLESHGFAVCAVPGGADLRENFSQPQ